jgi:hypothetical protein
MPQSLACVLLHVVFSTKERTRIIVPGVRADLHAFIGGIARDCRCPALSVGETETPY